jgi:death on curing protein
VTVRYLSKAEVLQIHRWALEAFGCPAGIRDEGLLDSALAQPEATFGGADLHATVAAKAGALGYSLLKNHAFVDGNKRRHFSR